MNRLLVDAEPAATEKLAEAQAQLTAMRIPPVDGETLGVAAVPSAEFHFGDGLQAGEH